MATKPTALATRNIIFRDGRYIIFDRLPNELHPGLITDKKRYQTRGYLLIGCRFPTDSEPGGTQVQTCLANISTGIVYAHTAGATKIETNTTTRDIPLYYGWVQGTINISQGVVEKEGTGRYFPINNPPANINTPFNPRLYYVKANPADTSKNRVYLIEKDTSSEDNVYNAVQDITSDLVLEELKSLDNDAIAYSKEKLLPMAEFASNRTNDVIYNNGILFAEFKQTIKVDVYPCLLFKENKTLEEIYNTKTGNDNTYIIPPVGETTTQHYNYQLLNEGWAYYVNDSSRVAFVSPTAAQTRLKELATEFLEKVPSHTSEAYEGNSGLYSSPYWRSRREHVASSPLSLSFSSLRKYIKCQ